MRRNLPPLIAIGLLIGLLYAESRFTGIGNNWLVLAFKTPLSILFVLTALLQPKVMPGYFKLIFIGLILGLAGDVCLAIPGPGFFKTGLVAFLGDTSFTWQPSAFSPTEKIGSPLFLF